MGNKSIWNYKKTITYICRQCVGCNKLEDVNFVGERNCKNYRKC